jgi:hypothetical protein
VGYTVTSSDCKWYNDLQNTKATLSYTRRGGIDYGQLRVQGTRVYTGKLPGCTSSTTPVDVSKEFVAVGNGMNVSVVLGSGGTSTETLTLTGADFSIHFWTWGSFKYDFVGADRSGKYEMPLTQWSAQN